MTRTELAAEAWRAWVKDKPSQSEDMAKGFREGFNFCLLGKIKVEGGDKGELISANFLLRDRLQQAKDIIRRLMHELVVSNIPYDDVELLVKDTEQFLREVDA